MDDTDFGTWATGLEGVTNAELVDELVRRGWQSSNKGIGRVAVFSPRNYDPQATRRAIEDGGRDA